jgi:hypothetical protein
MIKTKFGQLSFFAWSVGRPSYNGAVVKIDFGGLASVQTTEDLSRGILTEGPFPRRDLPPFSRVLPCANRGTPRPFRGRGIHEVSRRGGALDHHQFTRDDPSFAECIGDSL